LCPLFEQACENGAKNGLTQTGAGKHNFYLPKVASKAPSGKFVFPRRIFVFARALRDAGQFEVAYLTGFAREKQVFSRSRPPARVMDASGNRTKL
jgi:hypothetical protein